MKRILILQDTESGCEVTARSDLSGLVSSRRIPDVTAAQIKAWNEGRAMVQEAFPTMSAADREFLLSGATPEEWAEAFPDEEDEL